MVDGEAQHINNPDQHVAGKSPACIVCRHTSKISIRPDRKHNGYLLHHKSRKEVTDHIFNRSEGK